ncbi:uncharacterized protein LOC118712079 isoform X2 [Pipistrellus kuhlii]|uniref:uncharacterized protein LOC118712079 isoform X2 n=1 Tax=Pipistrellus kuhlii TaxID=59472 RepID=UPI001E26ECCF|nr:uncharacterized protein LOC118712079 isoform X2 [Pipistrellus kuhlii]
MSPVPQCAACGHLQEDADLAVGPGIFLFCWEMLFQLSLLTTTGLSIPISVSHFGFSSIRGRYVNVSVLEPVLVLFLSAFLFLKAAVTLQVPQSRVLSAARHQSQRPQLSPPPPFSLLVPQSTGETLRPLWGLMDKCYPVATQATTPEAPGGLNDAAPKEERDMLSAGERAGAGEGTVPGQGAASPTPAGKDVAEEKELAGSPGWEEAKVPAEPALPPSGDLQGLPVGAGEASAVQSQEERPGGWAPRLLRKLWLGWFPVSDGPETQKHQ